MPALAALLGNAFTAVVAFFAAFLTKKAAVAAAFAGFLIGGWITLQLALLALWTGLAYSMPPSLVAPLSVAAYLLPSNTSACVQAIVLAKVGRWLWDRQREWAAAVASA